MKLNFCHLLILSFVFAFLFSCKEKEIELEASPDMLFSVRTNEIVVEVKDVPNKKDIVEAIERKLLEKQQFVRGNIYEMKLSSAKAMDLYENLDSFYDKKIKLTGKYSFATDVMAVTFDFDGVANTFSINGYFGNGFYNHFVRNEGTGSHHVVEGSKVFCLHDDYTEELQEEYPDLISASIKTDMITIRRLETFK